MDTTETPDELSERVTESVRHALALVGPAERGYERMEILRDDAA